jgi:hypothetical protein
MNKQTYDSGKGAMTDLIDRLRSVKWEVIDDDDWDSRCVFVDMRPDDFEALPTEAAAALEAARENQT